MMFVIKLMKYTLWKYVFIKTTLLSVMSYPNCRAAHVYQQLTELNQNCSCQYVHNYCDVHLVYSLFWAHLAPCWCWWRVETPWGLTLITTDKHHECDSWHKSNRTNKWFVSLQSLPDKRSDQRRSNEGNRKGSGLSSLHDELPIEAGNGWRVNHHHWKCLCDRSLNMFAVNLDFLLLLQEINESNHLSQLPRGHQTQHVDTWTPLITFI